MYLKSHPSIVVSLLAPVSTNQTRTVLSCLLVGVASGLMETSERSTKGVIFSRYVSFVLQRVCGTRNFRFLEDFVGFPYLSFNEAHL